jgi:hypothetical protein
MLPNISNFSSDRPVFEYAPVTNFSSIPNGAITVESNSNEIFYVGKSYPEHDPQNFDVIKVSSSMMLEDGQCVDVRIFILNDLHFLIKLLINFKGACWSRT